METRQPRKLLSYFCIVHAAELAGCQVLPHGMGYRKYSLEALGKALGKESGAYGAVSEVLDEVHLKKQGPMTQRCTCLAARDCRGFPTCLLVFCEFGDLIIQHVYH